VDLRYVVILSNSIPISPTVSGTFVNGVWSGNIAMSQAGTNMVLRADDGGGHVAFCNPFTVAAAQPGMRPTLSSPRRMGGTFQCTLTGTQGQLYEILASTNLVNWTSLCILTNSTGTTNFTDSSAGFTRRFYRGHLWP
jgi:hypothetical protein